MTAPWLTIPWLTILGIGEDGLDGLPPASRAQIAGARLVVGGARHLALAAPALHSDRLAWPRPIEAALPAILAARPGPVVVLASGDPTCYGILPLLARHIPADQIRTLPAPSAFALARARLGWSAQDCAEISFCGRPLAALAPLLQPGTKILALSADATTPTQLAAWLTARGFPRATLHLLEALGGPHQRHRQATAADFAFPDIHPLNLLAIEVGAEPAARIIPLAPGLPDTEYAHDGQLTRREIRAITLSSLAPRRGELLWDIGAGAGSIGIEWMLRHPANRAIAIEQDATRADRAAANAERLGVPGLRIHQAAAPAAFAGLPPPDAAFIGGGLATPGLLDATWDALPAEARLVANAVTVESEAILIAAQARSGGSLTRIAISRLDAIGSMHGFRPAMTVTQLVAVKP